VSRLSALAAHPRRTIGALALVLAAVGITVGSGANFTAHAANPSNTFTAGTLTIGSSASSALFNAPNMKPGDNVNGTVDIANTGSVSGAFTLSTSSPVDTGGLLGQLDLKVEDCGLFNGTTAPNCTGANIVYSGKAGSLTSASLGTFASSAKHRYKFDVTLPSSTGNAFQGKTASVQFDWDAAAA
jgi:spore coat-associated protein N